MKFFYRYFLATSLLLAALLFSNSNTRFGVPFITQADGAAPTGSRQANEYPQASQAGSGEPALPDTAAPAVFDQQLHTDQITGFARIHPILDDPVDLPVEQPHPDALHELINQVMNDNPGQVSGVFVEDILALPVLQQPRNDHLFVSRKDGTVTLFRNAVQNGVTGLLAHNYLSGDLFFGLELGQEVTTVYGDGSLARYRITSIERYEKLPGSLQESDYVNLESGEVLDTPQLFNRMYNGEPKVTFQTCIKKDSDWSWGRIFIVATPLNN